MDLASRIQDLLDGRRMTQSDLARRTGLTVETINRIVRGVTKSPEPETIDKISSALGVSSASLRGESPSPLDADLRTLLEQAIRGIQNVLDATRPETRVLERSNVTPVKLGRKPPMSSRRRASVTDVSASDWRDIFENRVEDEEVDIPEAAARRGATLVFRADGESMAGEAIGDRDLLFVREEADPRRAHGRIVVCVVNGTAYVKRLEFAGSNIKLVSANDGNAPMVFHEDSVEWHLVGVVVANLHIR